MLMRLSLSFKIIIGGIIISFFLNQGYVYSSDKNSIKVAEKFDLTPKEKVWLKTHQTINVAGPEAFPPFCFKDNKNKEKGISLDYLHVILKSLGLKMNIHINLPWTQVLNMAKEKKIDLIACVAKTEDRMAYLSFSEPYLSFPLVIISRKDMGFIGNIDDLYGKKVAIIKKASPFKLLKKEKIKIDVHYVDTPLDGLKAVSFGQADARIENLATASYLIQTHGLSNLKIAAPTSYENYTLHMAVRKDFPELLSIINKALGAITSIEQSKIKNKWLSVRYEHGITVMDNLKWFLPILILSVIIVTMMLIWNRKLKNESYERKQVEKKLRASEQKYKYLFNNAPTGMYEIDFIQNKFISVNEIMCAYSGYSEQEFLKLDPLSFLTPKSRHLYIKRLKNFNIDKKLDGVIEYNIIKKDGSQLCVLLNGDYFFKEDQLIGAQVVVHDITQLKNAEKEKIKAQKIAGEQEKLALVGKIAGKMAHDFNNILGIIMGNTELSILDCKEPTVKASLELILGQTIRGKNLTKNLVAFAKDQEPKQEFFKLNEKIDLVLSLLKKDLKGIELIREYKPGVSELLADPGMIEHAMVNFVQNSIHAVSCVETPKIIIRTYSLNDNICFEIEDNGCGIPDKYIEKIYEPAFSLKGQRDVSQSYKPGIKGTGYGMSNIKKYVEQHKGTITVTSKIGMGSKFIITIPVNKKELTFEEKSQFKTQKLITGKKILLVEDETDISDVQYRILTQEPCNHSVDVAGDASAAIELFSKNSYDFISLDYILPGKMTGMDVYQYIRQKDTAIPILFISGNFTFLESIKELKQQDEYIDHLSKPCQNKNYVSSINQLMQKTALL